MNQRLTKLIQIWIAVVFAVLASLNPAIAQEELFQQEINTHFSGFITGTAFSDRTFYPNTYSLAVNGDVTYGDWAIRGQVAEPYRDSLRRLVVERSTWLGHRQDLMIQVGRFPRLDSFYNSVTDTAGTSDLAMLPLGEYNRRMVESRTFNSLLGTQAIYTALTDAGLFKVHLDYGSMEVEDQCNVQMEATKQICRDGYEIEGVRGNHDYGISYENGPWSLLAYYGQIRAKTNLIDRTDFPSIVFTTVAAKIKYSARKLGIKYSDGPYLAQTEYIETDFKLARQSRDYVSIQKAWSAYTLFGYYWTDEFSTTVSYSYGRSNTSDSNYDRAIGASYTLDSTVLSLEYHNGYGPSWKRYFSPTPDWDSWVVSLTHKF